MTKLNRQTKETKISCELDMGSTKSSVIDTGVGFLDHMLETLSKHSGTYIQLTCDGDLHIDSHHTVEDCGIVLGQLFAKELYPVSNIKRFACATVVMDEASATTSIDISNRPFLVYDIGDTQGTIGQLDIELVEEFFTSFVANSRMTVHIIKNRGKNKHHIVEAMFKSLALCIKDATAKTKDDSVPSTKGIV